MTDIQFRPAKRENVPLLIGVAGGTGSGKTYSALKLATGLAGGKRFALIDTESGRALHYADEFEFDHAALASPFRPTAYADAIAAADKAGYPVIVVDSTSHEHVGDGGLLDMHEAELERLAGTDARRREAMKMGAWIAPKMEHKRFVTRLLGIRAHVILCFRAEEKIEIAKEGGKTVVRPKQSLTGLDGWLPVSEKNLPYELTLSLLLTADQPGVPKAIKLPAQLRPFIPLDRPLSDETGRQLAEWASGGAPEAAEIAALTDQLLQMADQLDKRDATTGAIERHRSRYSLTQHEAWLQKQIANANAAIDEQLASETEEPDLFATEAAAA
jgi:hypothetical protein